MTREEEARWGSEPKSMARKGEERWAVTGEAWHAQGFLGGGLASEAWLRTGTDAGHAEYRGTVRLPAWAPGQSHVWIRVELT